MPLRVCNARRGGGAPLFGRVAGVEGVDAPLGEAPVTATGIHQDDGRSVEVQVGHFLLVHALQRAGNGAEQLQRAARIA